MRVLLDQQPYECDTSSVGAAIAAAASDAESRGRVLVEVIVDGDAWSEERLSSADLRCLLAGELSLVSADLAALVGETLAGAADALGRADVLQHEAATLGQAGRRADGLARLGEALEVWQTVHEAFLRCMEALRIDVQGLNVGDEAVADRIDRLGDRLRTIRGSLRADDPVGLADVLLYDMPAVVLEWREVLETMRSRVEESSGGSDGASA